MYEKKIAQARSDLAHISAVMRLSVAKSIRDRAYAIPNHVNIVRNAHGMFAYVKIGGLNEDKGFRIDNFEQAAIIQMGKLRHGIWPSGGRYAGHLAVQAR